MKLSFSIISQQELYYGYYQNSLHIHIFIDFTSFIHQPTIWKIECQYSKRSHFSTTAYFMNSEIYRAIYWHNVMGSFGTKILIEFCSLLGPKYISALNKQSSWIFQNANNENLYSLYVLMSMPLLLTIYQFEYIIRLSSIQQQQYLHFEY